MDESIFIHVSLARKKMWTGDKEQGSSFVSMNTLTSTSFWITSCKCKEGLEN
jgi:hypothetical protein